MTLPRNCTCAAVTFLIIVTLVIYYFMTDMESTEEVKTIIRRKRFLWAISVPIYRLCCNACCDSQVINAPPNLNGDMRLCSSRGRLSQQKVSYLNRSARQQTPQMNKQTPNSSKNVKTASNRQRPGQNSNRKRILVIG